MGVNNDGTGVVVGNGWVGGMGVGGRKGGGVDLGVQDEARTRIGSRNRHPFKNEPKVFIYDTE